jgi:predicted nucleic acid-binding Zn ribbon protein
VPLFEFACTADPAHAITETIFFNVTQRPAPAAVPCSTCGKPAERIVSAATGIFKGEGFDKKNTNPRRIRL